MATGLAKVQLHQQLDGQASAKLDWPRGACVLAMTAGLLRAGWLVGRACFINCARRRNAEFTRRSGFSLRTAMGIKSSFHQLQAKRQRGASIRVGQSAHAVTGDQISERALRPTLNGVVECEPVDRSPPTDIIENLDSTCLRCKRVSHFECRSMRPPVERPTNDPRLQGGRQPLAGSRKSGLPAPTCRQHDSNRWMGLERVDEKMRPLEQRKTTLANVDALLGADVDRFVVQDPVEVQIQQQWGCFRSRQVVDACVGVVHVDDCQCSACG